MGQSSSVAVFSAKMLKAAAEVERRQIKAITAAALSAKDIYEDAAARKGLVARKSKLIGRTWRGFGFRVKGRRNPSAIVHSRGPAWLHDSPTKGHWISARKSPTGRGNKRRRVGSKALRFGGGFADRVWHRGTRGKGWSKVAKKLIAKNSPEAYQRELSRGWRDVFR